MGALHFRQVRSRRLARPEIQYSILASSDSTTAEKATDTADATAMRRVFKIATAWCNCLPPKLTDVPGKAAPVIIAALIVQSVATDKRRKDAIISLEHAEACNAVIQHSVNAWNARRNAGRGKVSTLELLRRRFVDGIDEAQIGLECGRISQQAVSQRIARAFLVVEQESSELCNCDNLTLWAAWYDTVKEIGRRLESVRRFESDFPLGGKTTYRLPKRPERTKTSPRIAWSPGEADALIEAYIANGGNVTKCPTRPNDWSNHTVRPKDWTFWREAGEKTGRQHDREVERFLGGRRLITEREIADLNRDDGDDAAFQVPNC